ncbi:hypothetical protein D9M73_283140 [compost metagenome]
MSDMATMPCSSPSAPITGRRRTFLSAIMCSASCTSVSSWQVYRSCWPVSSPAFSSHSGLCRCAAAKAMSRSVTMPTA